MNDFNIVFSKSTDRGATWSTPVPVYGNVSWGDKPNFATSADGQHVYVLFNGPTSGDVYAATSHDFGATWTQVRVTNDTRYRFAYGTAVLPSGRVVSTQISFDYGGQGGAARGQVFIHVYASDNGGATWTDTSSTDSNSGAHARHRGATPTTTTAARRSRPIWTATS